jgi:fructuronate reductase
MGIDDHGREMNYNPTATPPWNRWSPDHLLEPLTRYVSDIQLGKPETVGDSLRPILSDREMFGIDLYAIGLGGKIEGYFKEMIAGAGAVRATLGRYIPTTL